MSTKANVMVTLRTKPSKKDSKPNTKQFEIDQANKLLSIKKSAWELADDKFEFNGIEIAKKAK